MTGFIVVLTTVPKAEDGSTLGRALVEEKLAACATVTPAGRSFYRWEGRICAEKECVLLIKTRASLFRRVEARIKALHPYRVPEIIALPIEKGTKDYLGWLGEETKG
jgi:periplasmic divalent cation tolerance protein